MTKEALIKNAGDLREGGNVPHVLHPSITMAELTFRYKEFLSELRSKFNGATPKPDLTK
jgi:hypothetical protein